MYVVCGKTGEYADVVMWLVAAFFDKNKAKDFVKKANQRAREWKKLEQIQIIIRLKDGMNMIRT